MTESDGIKVPDYLLRDLSRAVREHNYIALLAPKREVRPLTKQQKRRARRRLRKWKIGRRFYAIANKFGYFHDCECD